MLLLSCGCCDSLWLEVEERKTSCTTCPVPVPHCSPLTLSGGGLPDLTTATATGSLSALLPNPDTLLIPTHGAMIAT
jgi:hypothetical protein